MEQDIPITCKVKRSNPPARIQWQVKRNCHLGGKNCSSKYVTPDQSKFMIKSFMSFSQIYVNSHASGDYIFQCIANNSEGTDRHVIKFYHRRGRLTIFLLTHFFNKKPVYMQPRTRHSKIQETFGTTRQDLGDYSKST